MKLYHNPRCSKSREALSWLQQQSVNLEVIEYLKQPLSEQELRQLAKMLNISDPRLMMRTKDSLYKELQLDNAPTDTLFQTIAQYPALLERPILVHNHRATIGRPLENIQNLTNS